MFNEVINILKKRKSNLCNTLRSRSKDLTPEQQHQVYGAVNEIDLVLKTLDYYRTMQQEENMQEFDLVSASKQQKNTLFSKIFQ